MSLSDLGVIAEIVAAIAVVVSLIYLAVQIRQGTAQNTATASASVLNGIGYSSYGD